MPLQRSQSNDLTAFFPGMDASRAPASIGRVVATPGVLAGVSRLEGTRIPTAIIWEFFEDGADAAEILRAFPVLTADDVQAALDHEAVLRARTA